MQAVILAAGRGNRLQGVEGATPKCMIEIGGSTIVERQIGALRSCGVGNVVIVTGYEKARVQRFVSERFENVRYIDNDDFASTNTIHSLYLAIPALTEDFFYLNGDVLCAPSLVRRLLTFAGTGLAVEYKKCGGEEVKVLLEGNRIVAISKQVPPEKAAGEFIGIALFRGDMHPAFFESLRNNVEVKQNRRDYFERALDEIAASVELRSVDITGEPVIEIDFPEDLARARKLVAKVDAA
jgi:choline kinase